MELSEARMRAEPALVLQRGELAGDESPNRALGGLRSAPASNVIEMVEALREGDVEERMLAARLLVDSTLDGAQILRQGRAALETESSPDVLRWLTTALGSARSQDAIADLVTLASHELSKVRFAVPGSLSQCAGGVFEPVAEALLTLSNDPDDDVRWSAAFELGEWLLVSDDPRIRGRLVDLADDPAEQVRTAVSRAIAEAGGP